MKLTILHPLATNALKSRPLLGQMKSGFKLLPEILGQKDTFRDSMAWQCLLMADRPVSVKLEQPLRSKEVKVRPAAKQIWKKKISLVKLQRSQLKKSPPGRLSILWAGSPCRTKKMADQNKWHTMHAEAMTFNDVLAILDIEKQTSRCIRWIKVTKIVTECVWSEKN